MLDAATHENPRLAAALSYARHGWPVFPCRPYGKKPYTAHGVKDATIDEALICEWWTLWLDANVAIATGAGSGVVVIDTDKKPDHGIDGEETLRALELTHGPLPKTVMQITAGGGSQRFFHSPGVPIPNSAGKVGPGLDVRGDGGYVIVPPSIHPNRRIYEWEVLHHPDAVPLAGLPPAWIELLRSQGNGAQAGTEEAKPIREGQRNDTLFRLACAMRARGMSHAAVLAALLAENQARCQPPLPEAEVQRVVGGAARYTPKGKESRPAVITRLSEVTSCTVRWLWPGRIPLGKVTVRDGDPGLGKSLLSIGLAARMSTLQSMPDGAASDLSEPAGVVILSAEDDLADTIRPRLEAAGADLSRIVALTAIREGEDERLPTLLDLEAIRHEITHDNARLLIIDPLMAYLPSKVDSYRDQDVRRSLAPLAALAAETGVAVLVIRHLNKNGNGNALYRGGGSIGIIGAARSGLLVAKDPDDPDGERRILVSTKSNLAKLPSALAYRIAVTAENVPFLVWEGPTSHTAATLLAQQADGEERSALEEAKDFLRDVLANGAVPARGIQKQADQAGISYATLRRAKTALKVIARKQEGFFSKDKKSQQWCWMLPPSEPQPAAEDAQDPAEDAQKHEHEHLQQSSEKNTRNFNGVTEDAQDSEFEHLQATEDVEVIE